MKLAVRAWLFAILLTFITIIPHLATAGMTPEEVEKFENFKPHAEKGNFAAQLIIGYCYYKGEGVDKNLAQAAVWIRKAADQDYSHAQGMIGYCYQYGEGVEKDPAQAVSWYRKAAEQGNALAQLNLGACLADGIGVKKNEIEAYAYWSIAKISNSKSIENLTILEKKLSVAQITAGQVRTKELQKEIEAKIATKKAGK